jgi:hypothetical protein
LRRSAGSNPPHLLVRKRRVSEPCRGPEYSLLMLKLGCGFLVEAHRRFLVSLAELTLALIKPELSPPMNSGEGEKTP